MGKMGQLALGPALEFVAALDEPNLEDRTARLRSVIAPGATWWIDTGRDRLAGRRGIDPGPVRPWPLHGTMPMEEKLQLVLQAAPVSFPHGLGRRVVSRAFANDEVALVEAQGDGVHASGKLYRNRYAFVIDVGAQGIESVREYLDTMHAEDVFGGARLSKPTVAPPPEARDVTARNQEEALALALWPALEADDIDAFGALFASDGTWWTDSGTNRELGAFDCRGDARDGWPLHGLIPIDEKLETMRTRIRRGYANATIAVTPVRLFSDAALVALEAEGYAKLSSGRVYQNRYVFVVETNENQIRQVREYCDTLHVVEAVV